MVQCAGIEDSDTFRSVTVEDPEAEAHQEYVIGVTVSGNMI